MDKKSTKERRPRRRLPDDVKLDIVKEYHLGRRSQKELSERYGVGQSTISDILRNFAAENQGSALLMKKDSTTEESEVVRRLKEENADLRKRLHDERMRADFYETMVDVADEIYHTDIRKKAGTSQPRGCTKRGGATRS